MPAPLLRIVEQRFEAGEAVASDEVMIFRDGMTVALRTSPAGESRILRGQALREEVATLGNVLASHRVGAQTAGCSVEGLPTALAGTPARGERRALISWFGNGGRDRHLEVSSAAGSLDPPCHFEMEELARRTLEFSRGVLLEARLAEAVDRSLLFELDSSMQTLPGCRSYGFVERTLVFRDGLVLRLVEDTDRQYLFERAQIAPAALETLHQTLIEQRVGFQASLCRTWFFLPFLLEERCVEPEWESSATWHGRGGRRAELRGHRHVSLLCAPEQSAIRVILLTTLIDAVTSASAVRTTGRLVAH